MANDKNISPSQNTSSGHASNTAAPASSSKISSMNKRQQAAHRARMTALHKQLTTRLQYAAFKVEHGWSKQSLSEVENLFYKHRRVSGSGYSPNASTTPSTRKLPSTSLPPPPTTPTSSWRATSPTAKKFRVSSGSASAEGMGGLVTPPASGNTLPIASSSSYDRRKTTNQQSPSSGHRKISISSGGGGSGGGGGNAGGGGNNSGRSYADFWSKIGGAVTPAANGQ